MRHRKGCKNRRGQVVVQGWLKFDQRSRGVSTPHQLTLVTGATWQGKAATKDTESR